MSTKTTSQAVILATAQIRANIAGGDYILLSALIDQGSQITTISEEAAQILKLPRMKTKTKLYGLSDAVVGESKATMEVEIKPRFLSNHKEKVNAVGLPILTSAQPDLSFNYNFKIWEKYTLADPLFNKSHRIDMVIGGDVFSSIIESGIKKDHGVLGQATKFGWILSGIKAK